MGRGDGYWGWFEGEAGRVGGVGNDLGMAGGVCRWAVFFPGHALLLACSVVVELLILD